MTIFRYIKGRGNVSERDWSEEQVFAEVRDLCQSKADEFALLGYESVTAEDVWECVKTGYKNGFPPIHRLVNDVLSLKATKYMNWLMMKMYQG